MKFTNENIFYLNLPFVASALRCWKCTSDGDFQNALFCNDPFDENIAADRSRFNLIECGHQTINAPQYPYNNQAQTLIPVCKKAKYNGKTISQCPSNQYYSDNKFIHFTYYFF